MRQAVRQWSIVLAAVTLTVGLGTVGSAQASGDGGGVYPPTKPAIGVSTGVVGPGTGFTISASGFCPGQPVTFALAGAGNYFFSVPVVADGAGKASYFVNPADIPATGISYTVYAKITSGSCNGQAATTTVSVLPFCKASKTESTLPLCVNLVSPPSKATTTSSSVPDECDDVVFLIDQTEQVVDEPVDCPPPDDGDCPLLFLSTNQEVPVVDDDDCPVPCLFASGLEIPISEFPPCPAEVVTSELPASNAPDTKAGAQPSVITPPAIVPAIVPGAGTVSASQAALLPAPVVVPSAVLSSGLVAGPSATPAAATAAAAAAAPAAPAAAPGDELPATGSEPSRALQIALVALASGLGMVAVAGLRRRKQAGSTNPM